VHQIGTILVNGSVVKFFRSSALVPGLINCRALELRAPTLNSSTKTRAFVYTTTSMRRPMRGMSNFEEDVPARPDSAGEGSIPARAGELLVWIRETGRSMQERGDQIGTGLGKAANIGRIPSADAVVCFQDLFAPPRTYIVLTRRSQMRRCRIPVEGEGKSASNSLS